MLLPFAVAGLDPFGAFAMLGLWTLVGGVPYALLCTALLVWLRGEPSERYVRVLAWSPISFLLPLNGFVGPAMLLSEGPGALPSIAPILLNCSTAALLIGFSYVAIAYWSYRMAARFGVFAPAA